MVSSKLVAATLRSASSSVYVQDVYDTFIVNCQPLTAQRRDPIVSSGADLSDHVYSVIGGSNFFAGTTPANALASAATTCDKEVDHSIYWVPNCTTSRLITRQAVYYQNRACDYEPGRTSRPSYKTSFARPFPEDLQMLPGGKIPFSEKKMRVKWRRVMVEED
ncbi:hypothetical protein DL769_000503 [Monosporascus sp. CRB-8-3]|nr:hypothetical protein DL769_000503 [Monosporascus sp. CRB-8-3]